MRSGRRAVEPGGQTLTEGGPDRDGAGLESREMLTRMAEKVGSSAQTDDGGGTWTPRETGEEKTCGR